MRTSWNAGCVHSHHRMNSKSKSIDPSSHFSIQGFLGTISFFAYTSSPEPSRHDVPRKCHNGSVTHHVVITFCFEANTTVGYNNDCLDIHPIVFFCLKVIFKLHKLFWDKTIVFSQPNLIVWLFRQFWVCIDVRILIGKGNVYVLVDTDLLELFYLMVWHIFIYGHAYCLFNRDSNRIN